jgi:hypothetical protein
VVRGAEEERLNHAGSRGEIYMGDVDNLSLLRRRNGRGHMDRRKASDFPQELLDLFDRFVQGGINRRQFLDRAQRFAVGGVTAAALFQMLKSNYAWAIQIQPDEKRIKAESATVPSPRGNGSISRAIWSDQRLINGWSPG